jgi:beta-N-acetylhexosaminidase
MPRWWNWYTRTTQNRMPQGLRVRLPPEAPSMLRTYYLLSLAAFVLAIGYAWLAFQDETLVATTTEQSATIHTLDPPDKPPAPLADKVGQLLLVGIRGTSTTDELRDFLLEVKPGGIVLFERDGPGSDTLIRNIASPKQLKQLTTSLQAAAPTPLFIAIDAEGGRVDRLRPDKGFSTQTLSVKTLGNQPIASTTKVANQIASELASLGINFNFAPVVDVNINKDSPAIGKLGRSYSADPTIVTSHANAFINAHHEHHIITSLKHFPGHGSAGSDTHLGLVEITSTYQPEVELAPYKSLIASGYQDTIMTAHVIHEAYDTVPATLSPIFITKLLREELGYDGVVISDDMQMGAIADTYGLAEAAIMSLQAGVDIILIANQIGEYDLANVKEVRDAIVDAVENGKIDQSHINTSYERILKLKRQYDLLQE